MLLIYSFFKLGKIMGLDVSILFINQKRCMQKSFNFLIKSVAIGAGAVQTSKRVYKVVIGL